ncbi:MAG: VOC family protein [Bacteroidota bacterium]|nr:VOC family protein [Bacteroidota bacterium]
MANQIYPCLWFDGNAKEAAAFYCSVFKNSKIGNDTPMVVTFDLNGLHVMGLNGGPMYKINPSISLFAVCETVNEANDVWSKLIDGGSVLMPIDKYPWSERYGWLQDKFGLTWQISGATLENAKLKITQSMLFTGKQFGRAKEAIDYYSSIFENSSVTQLFYYPAEDKNAGKVLFSEFKLNQYDIMAMDGPGVHEYTFNEAVSFVVECQTQEEIDHYWNKLTSGGQESMCGWLVDKFGVSWQIIPANLGKLMSDPAKAPAVIQAIMKMKKIDMTLINF